MKYLRQFGIVLIISFLGEVLKYMIPLPIPASIYGFVMLFLALHVRLLRVEQIKEVSDFLITIMPIMFVPAGAGLVQSWAALSDIAIPVSVITVLSTVLVMAVSGRVTQWLIRRQKGDRA